MQATTSTHPSFALGLALALLFLGAFALLWLFVTLLLAYLSGWAKLTESFGCSTPPAGRRFDLVSGRIGGKLAPVRYRNCLTVIVAEAGFFLSVWPLFRGFKSGDLFIPWSAVERIDERTFFMMTYRAIHLAGRPTVLSFYGKAGEEIAKAWAKRR